MDPPDWATPRHPSSARAFRSWVVNRHPNAPSGMILISPGCRATTLVRRSAAPKPAEGTARPTLEFLDHLEQAGTAQLERDVGQQMCGPRGSC